MRNPALVCIHYLYVVATQVLGEAGGGEAVVIIILDSMGDRQITYGTATVSSLVGHLRASCSAILERMVPVLTLLIECVNLCRDRL